MKISRTTYRIVAIAGTIGVALALTAPVQAASSKPAGVSKAEYRALMFRSDGLNKQYHLGKYSRVPQTMTVDEYRALTLRSEGINKKYHLASWTVSPASATVTAGGGFSWSAFGIGAAGMLGVVLLAAGAIVGGHYGRRAPRTRISS